MRTWSELNKERKGLVGTFVTLGLETYELACQSGVDLVVADAQHGAFALEDLRHAARIADAEGRLAIARLPAHGAWMTEALLDAGFAALITPMVNTAEQARAWVEQCYYPPLGVRSQSTCRASIRGGSSYRSTFNARFTCLVMIEHIAAVEQIDEILAVPGISGCFIGPSDLESSLGNSAGDSKLQLASAIERVRAAAQRAGKVLGIAAATVQAGRERAAQGFDFVIVSTDRKMLRDATGAIAAGWHEEIRGAK